MQMMRGFTKQVNASIVDPAFSCYENGKTKPSPALVKPLKVLERYPDLRAG